MPILDIGNGQIAPDLYTGKMTFLEDFCKITQDTDDLIEQVFPTIVQQSSLDVQY